MEGKPSRSTFRLRLDAMVHRLREDIITGKLPVGSYLPSEDDLGTEFQLSKKSVRRGLEVLVDENLIVKKPKVGNMVIRPEDDSEKLILRFGYYPGSDKEANLSALLDAFERKYTHIHVKRVMLHFDSYQDYAFVHDHMLDVIMLNYNNFRLFQTEGAQHLLSAQQEDAGIYPFLNKAFKVDGQLLAKPFIFSPVVLCYNKEHFRDAGLQEPDSSWKWEDFCCAASQLTITEPENKRLGFYFHLLSYNRWPLFLLQHGFSLLKDEEGLYRLKDDSFMESMKMIRELFAAQKIIPSFVSQSDVDTERLFQEGKASMILSTYFNLNNLKSVPFEYDISPVPYIHLPQTLLLNIGLAIHQQSPQKEAAELLVNFLTSREALESIRRERLSLPSVKEVAEHELDMEGGPSRYQMFREIIPSYRYYTDMGVEMEHLTAMLHHLKLYWSEMLTTSEMVDIIERELNKETLE